MLTFYQTGAVQTATLANDTSLRPVGWENNTNNGNAGFVKFKGGTEISFTQDGYVTNGTLDETTTWQNPNGSSSTLPPKTVVSFTITGIQVAE